MAVEVKHIVAAIGFGHWTASVLQTASEMAAAYSAKVTAVYAEQFAPPVYFSNKRIREEQELRRKAAREHLEKVVKTCVESASEVETRLVEMPPAEAIVRTIRDTDADMAVLGAHKRQGLKRFMMGAVPERVFRQIQIPMVTVRGAGPEASGHYGKILCPVNFSKVARRSLEYAADLAQKYNAELEVMTSLEEDEGTVKAREQKLEEWVPDEIQERCKLNATVTEGEAAEEILKTAREGGHDLIVIGAQHRPLLEASIYGTTSIRVMRHAQGPVMTVVRR